MTCKNCVHYDVCPGYLPSDLDKDVWDLCAQGKVGEISNIEERCDQFRDKSKFIELPCSLGSYCIYKSDIWYIDKILYLGMNVFFTSLINMASHRFTRAPVEEIQFISEDIEELQKKLEALNHGN